MNQIVVILGLCLLLGISLFSFPKDFGNVPQQEISRLTGYKAWHPKVIGYSSQMSDAMIFLTLLTTGAASYLSIKWTEKLPLNKKYISYFIKDGDKVPTIAFDRIIAYYVTITFIAVVAYVIFDVGKLWSATGVLHNVFEIAVMLSLHYGGKLESHVAFIWMGVYVFLVISLNLWLEWPQDASWFKFQGLCLDYSLIVVFVRLYFTTLKKIREYESMEIPLNRDDIAQTTDFSFNFYPNTVHHPSQIWLLILASIVHLIGNIGNSIWVDSGLA
ncbi:4959_t:CDS:2 [Cetraspora pellucida]|uniref:4959_t:CDS:1 n=1 Tax=Cetraspora pellucida TaxID=1433469 RepID=A0A9N9E1I1_9GLOM|nr:4959_t:CDS:2 [Cetraspora pellucida]